AEGVAERARQGIEQGGYQEVGVGHKLAMFLQVRDAFGWDPIRETLTSYSTDQDEDPSRLPANEQAERDQMALRLSQATGHNLVPFMRDLWKLPISAEIEAQVESLPGWMPEGF
ncbi:MAG: M60 family metallopeptidase, partial [Phycisphaerales bacterium JB063]